MLLFERGAPLLNVPPRLAFEAALGARFAPEVFIQRSLIFPFRFRAAVDGYSREFAGEHICEF